MTAAASSLLRRGAAVVCAVLVALTTAAAPAWAEPTPAPHPTPNPNPTPAPGPTPNPTPGPDPGKTCLGDASRPNLVKWCFTWVTLDESKDIKTPTRWLTLCSKAKAAEELNACEAASLTLDSPPPDRSPSVLADGKPDHNAPLVLCNLFADKAAQDSANAERWKAKGEQCKGLEAFYLAKVFVPKEEEKKKDDKGCGVTDIECRVGKAVADALAAGIRSGIQGLVDLTVQAMAWLLGELAKIVFDTTSLQSPDDTYYWTYNQIAGVLLLLVFVFFLISTIINGLRVNGPGPVATLGGLVRAVVGITFAGGIAWVIVRAWDEATATLIERNSTRQWDPSIWIKAITALAGGGGTAFLALLIAIFAVFGLILVFIQLWFRGILALGAGLFGGMAMTGQVMPETRHWGRRWFWTVNALASSKFWVAALWIYGSREIYQSNNLITVLKGLTLIWLMVFAPAIMLRLTSMWDGYLSDVHAQGVLSAVGHATGVGNVLDRATSMLGGRGGGGPGDAASGLMNANSADIPTNPADSLDDERRANNEAVDAVQTGEDGGRVGDPSQAGDEADEAARSAAGGESGHDDVGHPNADEADATQAGADSARHDVADGELTPPGDAAGSEGSVPLTPHAAAADAPGPGGDGGSGGGGGASPDGGPAPMDGGGAGGSAGDTPPSHAGGGGSGGDGSGGSGGGGSAAASGGAGSAAAGAAGEVPIVPV